MSFKEWINNMSRWELCLFTILSGIIVGSLACLVIEITKLVMRILA